MPRRRDPAPLTVQELELMKIVWELGAPTVRDVYEKLRESRKTAYTTVMTMMNILVEKGRLKRTLRDRAYVYKPAQPRAKVMRAMVRDFVGRVFDGSAKPLLVQLLEDRKLTQEDLEEIRAMIRAKEEK